MDLEKTKQFNRLRFDCAESTSMDTYGIYGHNADGEAMKTAKMVRDNFNELLLGAK